MQLNKLIKNVEKLCTPAMFYLGLSTLSILSMLIQNILNPDAYCCGSFQVRTPINKFFYFAFKILYVVGWTYILNVLCKKGYNKLSWLLVLLPLIMMFVIIATVMLFLKKYSN